MGLSLYPVGSVLVLELNWILGHTFGVRSGVRKKDTAIFNNQSPWVGGEEPRFAASAYFYGVNIPTVATVKLPTVSSHHERNCDANVSAQGLPRG